MEDYNILTTEGNIAFYQSCEITELFLYEKNTKKTYNFFTLAVFEEKPFTSRNEKYLTNKPITINSTHSMGIKQFWLSNEESSQAYLTLINKNNWEIDGKSFSQFPELKILPKQMIPATDGNRLNNVIKNNFHNGSFILECFDEEKNNFDFLLKIEAIKELNKLSDKIKQILPIDLSVVRDRIGNFIFQFPITILDTNPRALTNWDGVEINFIWHSKILAPPECLIQVESTIDKNYMGSIIEKYNKRDKQIINIGNLDQKTHIKIWKKEPSLILAMFDGSFIRHFDFDVEIINPEPRLVEINGKVIQIQVSSNDFRNKKKEKVEYTKYINNSLYNADKTKLEKTLSFKQYKNVDNNMALDDLRRLISQNDENGVYLWDPFLRANDIFKTLFFSKMTNVDLKAIGSIDKTTNKVYGTKGKIASQIINEERLKFENPNNNNYGLILEFRMQHGNNGWAFHDRFLIFPGNEINKPKVYALGSSINSFGTEHNILQEVSHPQPVVDAFNELWDKLNTQNCIVWKSKI